MIGDAFGFPARPRIEAEGPVELRRRLDSGDLRKLRAESLESDEATLGDARVNDSIGDARANDSIGMARANDSIGDALANDLIGDAQANDSLNRRCAGKRLNR